MNDDSEGLLTHRDRDALLYDWFKHLTSLSLLTLGGVLSLSQVVDSAEIKKPILAGVLVAVALAGVLAFSGAEQIVRAKTRSTPVPNQVLILQKVAPVILSMAVGAFLYIFLRALN
jgi:ABC-type xylose transport system permease subunit